MSHRADPSGTPAGQACSTGRAPVQGHRGRGSPLPAW